MVDDITHKYIKIEKSTLIIANIFKFRKNAQEKIFDCLYDMKLLLTIRTIPLHQLWLPALLINKRLTFKYYLRNIKQKGY